MHFCLSATIYFNMDHYSVIPESFRWYIANDKPEKAKSIIRCVARYNQHEKFDIDKALRKPETHEHKKYTMLHLFRSKHLVKVTILLAFNW